MLVRRLPLAAAAVAGVFVLSACEPLGGEGPGHGYALTPEEGGEEASSFPLLDPEGEPMGSVEVEAHEESLAVHVEMSGLEPGFHGFHVHGIGACEPDSADPEDPTTTGDFLSAGGHLAEESQEHAEHAGDMPSLYAAEDGTAVLQFETDSITLDDVVDEDGAAFMVHDGPDNFANIPERYAPGGPDEETLATGDAGVRVACAVVEPAR